MIIWLNLQNSVRTPIFDAKWQLSQFFSC